MIRDKVEALAKELESGITPFNSEDRLVFDSAARWLRALVEEVDCHRSRYRDMGVKLNKAMDAVDTLAREEA